MILPTSVLTCSSRASCSPGATQQFNSQEVKTLETMYKGIPLLSAGRPRRRYRRRRHHDSRHDISAFPDAPNLATIGTDEDGETILYTAKTTDSLSGCTRGVEGTAKAWPSGTTIARNFTNKDFDALQKNIQEAKKQADQGVSDAASAKSAAATAQSTANAVGTAASGAQSTANAAGTAASNAQTAADNAQTAADNAQSAADDAQSAIDEHAADKQNPHGVTAAQVGAAAASHKHGNLTSDGKLGSTANLPVFTGTGGLAQAEAVLSAAAKLGRGYGACSTAAATKAKAVTLRALRSSPARDRGREVLLRQHCDRAHAEHQQHWRKVDLLQAGEAVAADFSRPATSISSSTTARSMSS